MRRIRNWYFSPDIRFPALVDAAVAEEDQPDIDLVAGRLRLHYRSRFFPSANPWYQRHAIFDRFGPACPVYYLISPPEVKTLSQFEYIVHLVQNTEASPLVLHHVWYFRHLRPDPQSREFFVAHERFLPRDLDVNTQDRGQYSHEGRLYLDALGEADWRVAPAVLWRLETDPADSRDLLLQAIDYRQGAVVNQGFRRQRGPDQIILRLAKLGVGGFGVELARHFPGSDPAALEARAPALLARDDERRRRERAGPAA
jgi:hypothetical protein